jgi:hypothetical protein
MPATNNGRTIQINAFKMLESKRMSDTLLGLQNFSNHQVTDVTKKKCSHRYPRPLQNFSKHNGSM